MTFEQWLQAKGFGDVELSDAQRATLLASYNAENKGGIGAGDADLDAALAAGREDRERREKITRLTIEASAEFPHLAQQIENMARTAIGGTISAKDYELNLLRATRPSLGDMRPGSGREAQYNGGVIEAALCKTGMLKSEMLESSFDERTLDAADRYFPKGVGLKQLLVLAAQANGYHGYNGGQIDLELQRAAFGKGQYSIRASGGFSTLNISTIVSNTANKFKREGWNSVDQTPLRIAATRPTNDLKELTTVSLLGGSMFEKVNAAGEIVHGTLGEVTYGNKADLFALLLRVTMEHYLNDDVGALTAAPKKLGISGMRTLAHLFFTEFMDNSTFFTTGRGNLDEGTDGALSLSALEIADGLLMAQTDPDGNPLGAEGAILFVPSVLKNTALTLMSSSTVVGGSSLSPDKNVFAGRYRVEHSSYLANSKYTGYSAKKWYLLTDPNLYPTIELVALNGRVEPTIETSDASFDVLGFEMRGHYGVGFRKQEYRGGVAMKGEN